MRGSPDSSPMKRDRIMFFRDVLHSGDESFIGCGHQPGGSGRVVVGWDVGGHQGTTESSLVCIGVSPKKPAASPPTDRVE